MVLPSDEANVNSQAKWDWLRSQATRFNLYMLDNFEGTENIFTANTGTGYTTAETFNLQCETGVQANSVNKWYYDSKYFNPLYAQTYIRWRINNPDSCFMFIGFKDSLDDPTWDMTESHYGIMLHDDGSGGQLYLSSANTLGAAPGQQRQAISGILPQSDYIYKLGNNALYTYQLPVVIPYFDSEVFDKLQNINTYQWLLKATNNSFPPDDQSHYFMFYISNTVGANKQVNFRQITYGERYVD